MMRRRPIARMAVRTTAVVGTAAVVGGHMANKQAAQAQQAAPGGTRASTSTRTRARSGCTGSHRAAHPVGCAEGLRGAHRGRVRGGEGQDPGVGACGGRRAEIPQCRA